MENFSCCEAETCVKVSQLLGPNIISVGPACHVQCSPETSLQIKAIKGQLQFKGCARTRVLNPLFHYLKISYSCSDGIFLSIFLAHYRMISTKQVERFGEYF